MHSYGLILDFDGFTLNVNKKCPLIDTHCTNRVDRLCSAGLSLKCVSFIVSSQFKPWIINQYFKEISCEKERQF